MSIVVEKTGEDAASKSLRVTVPLDRVREAEDRALKYYTTRARLPGFRPGKAPVGVVRKRFGDAIRQSVLEEVIRESWETARQSESLKPIADPSIRNLKFEADSPIEFELLVEVRPEIKLEREGGFRLTRTVAPVADPTVEEQVQRLREDRSAWLPVENERPVPGQMVR
ncbi:MAG TPA: trigger factor family protein, partial [Gemmatimonadales bacterium]|nr:trigger factor family protein [Gemmatimonadales bacterium]